MGRSLVILTTLVGGAGLGLALGYMLLVVVAFLPQGQPIAVFLIGEGDGKPGYGFALVVVPYALLLVHLWLRMRVGAMLLERGDVALAEKFSSRRLKHNLLRGKREALANRVVLIRLAIRTGEYARAEELAAQAVLPRRPIFGSSDLIAAFHRWRLEAALRAENLVLAREIVQQAWPIGGRPAADFCACAAELAVRNDDPLEFARWRERAEFSADRTERFMLAEAFAARRFGTEPEDPAALAEQLAQPLEWLRDVPLASGEVRAVRAHLLAAAGEPDRAAQLLEAPGEADARSTFVLRSTRDALADS